ncbi:hypothetical protein AVMA1855_22440 [Acidovorax sp. SUPP1855]|nr:hypothetical protein [Acidovorax sp. SUPP1855]GKS86962.1 hypothetical protein AVMA1855_22440 [Acidovorax sp. SUPP1855]
MLSKESVGNMIWIASWIVGLVIVATVVIALTGKGDSKSGKGDDR